MVVSAGCVCCAFGAVPCNAYIIQVWESLQGQVLGGAVRRVQERTSQMTLVQQWRRRTTRRHACIRKVELLLGVCLGWQDTYSNQIVIAGAGHLVVCACGTASVALLSLSRPPSHTHTHTPQCRCTFPHTEIDASPSPDRRFCMPMSSAARSSTVKVWPHCAEMASMPASEAMIMLCVCVVVCVTAVLYY